MDEQTQAQTQTPDTSANPSAARMEAILHLILSSETDEELEQNKALAQKVLHMSDDEIRGLMEQPSQHAREGDFIQTLRRQD